MKRTSIYVMGPYTEPDPVVNTRQAMDAWVILNDAGYLPVCPHLSHFIHLVHPHSYSYWMEHDLALLELCDTCLRLPGLSPGADLEEEKARTLGKYVHHMSAEHFVEKFGRCYDGLNCP